MAQKYEVVVWTASQSKYANPVLDEIDPNGYCYWRLFRDSCVRSDERFVQVHSTALVNARHRG